jgi:hypothetical protein
MNAAEDGAKRTVHGVVVKVLCHRRSDRGMRLEEYASRCVRRGELHELVSTDHEHTDARMDRVGFLGFAEITVAGVLDRGDEVLAGDRVIGTVLGFDACHFPNHYNILIRTPAPCTGPDLGFVPELAISFRQPGGA